MTRPLILASGSAIRATLLTNAAIPFTVQVPRIDEEAIKASLLAEEAKPRDIADTLAEMKARKIADKAPGARILACDQVLSHDGALLSKPATPDEAEAQILSLSGQRHTLYSAAVLYDKARPIWRHVGSVHLTMARLSPDYVHGYVRRNWDSIRHAVGAYKLEEEGVRLFTKIDGDYFNVLGMPLLELLAFLADRGDIDR
ncbi:MAG: septum formation protein Maf [Rhodobacteraceae bacterium]|nr:septum formation protein Maf [Paracoccaceae bacterium]